jgi:hypothetical protein
MQVLHIQALGNDAKVFLHSENLGNSGAKNRMVIGKYDFFHRKFRDRLRPSPHPPLMPNVTKIDTIPEACVKIEIPPTFPIGGIEKNFAARFTRPNTQTAMSRMAARPKSRYPST